MQKKQAKITSLWRPQSHLIIYHIQTLNGAALKTEQETGSFTEAKQHGFYPRTAFEYTEPELAF